MSIQSSTVGALSSFEGPIGVSIVSKLTKWSSLQELGFAAQLTYLDKNFHGLNDFIDQMSIYSGSNTILAGAWSLIYPTQVPMTPEVSSLMYTDPVLGQVGLQFLSLINFGQTLALSPSQLNQPAMIASLVSIAASSAPSISSSTVGV